ncbi:MAG: hypothetical protein H6Q48_1085, partial [Deltaproteobacteria bacterium]|nr:hypothetical protein [Deltaproteobacteria bacterium]
RLNCIIQKVIARLRDHLPAFDITIRMVKSKVG